MHKLCAFLRFVELCFGLSAAFMVAVLTPIAMILVGIVIAAAGNAHALLWLTATAVISASALGSIRYLAGAAEYSPEWRAANEWVTSSWKEQAPLPPEMAWGVRLGQSVLETRWYFVAPCVLPWMVFYLLSGIPPYLVHRWLLAAGNNPGSVGNVVAGSLIIMSFSVAMHAYLILAAAGLFRSQRVVLTLWNWRFGVDLVMTGATLIITAVFA